MYMYLYIFSLGLSLNIAISCVKHFAVRVLFHINSLSEKRVRDTIKGP